MSQFPDMGQPASPAPFATVPGYPPPRKSRWWLWLLIGMGGAGAIVCCGCAGLMYFGVSAAGNVMEGPMLSKLNADTVVQEKLGTVTSAKWDMMATSKATEAAKSGKAVMVFHVTGEKGKGDVHADQAPGEKMFENARLIMGSEEFPLGFGISMTNSAREQPLVGVIMGSKSDSETLRHAAEMLAQFGIAHESQIVSAHRTPDWMNEYAKTAESRGIEVIIAGAGGAAHLPGMVASQSVLPVLGVPVQSKTLSGLDSLLSIVQMPSGVPVGTLAIGEAGAKNAALLAIRILANTRPEPRKKLHAYRDDLAAKVRQETVP